MTSEKNLTNEKKETIIDLKNINKQELHNIGECLLDCIHSHKYRGGFNDCCCWYDGQQPWEYNKDKYLIKIVCDLFDLNYKEQLDNYGYPSGEEQED